MNRVLLDGNHVTAGAALRMARKTAGISQSRIAINLDRPQTTVCRWEREAQGMRVANWLAALAQCGYVVRVEKRA